MVKCTTRRPLDIELRLRVKTHPDLVEYIRSRAIAETRPLRDQIIHMLLQYMKEQNDGK